MMAAERGAARATLDNYRRDLADFATFASGRGTEAAQASGPLLREYLASLAERGLSAATAARRLSALRQFFCFLFAEGVRSDDPTLILDGPRRSRPRRSASGKSTVRILGKLARPLESMIFTTTADAA